MIRHCIGNPRPFLVRCINQWLKGSRLFSLDSRHFSNIIFCTMYVLSHALLVPWSVVYGCSASYANLFFLCIENFNLRGMLSEGHDNLVHVSLT